MNQIDSQNCAFSFLFCDVGCIEIKGALILTCFTFPNHVAQTWLKINLCLGYSKFKIYGGEFQQYLKVCFQEDAVKISSG